MYCNFLKIPVCFLISAVNKIGQRNSIMPLVLLSKFHHGLILLPLAVQPLALCGCFLLHPVIKPLFGGSKNHQWYGTFPAEQPILPGCCKCLRACLSIPHPNQYCLYLCHNNNGDCSYWYFAGCHAGKDFL